LAAGHFQKMDAGNIPPVCLSPRQTESEYFLRLQNEKAHSLGLRKITVARKYAAVVDFQLTQKAVIKFSYSGFCGQSRTPP
jgi:uncharacterized protein (UPF0303 family)